MLQQLVFIMLKILYFEYFTKHDKSNTCTKMGKKLSTIKYDKLVKKQ